MKNIKEKMDRKNLLIMASVVLAFIVLSFFAFRYVKISALGGGLLNNSLIINNFSTNPASPVVWSANTAGTVNFDVWVRGRSGVIDYYLWSHCPNYNASTVYDENSLATVCGKAADTTESVIAPNRFDNNNLTYTYLKAGKYKPVVLVRRNGVYIHKSYTFDLQPLVDVYASNSKDNVTYNALPGLQGKYSPGDVQTQSILYADYLKIGWDVLGINAADVYTCTASVNWAGPKGLNGPDPERGPMTGGSYRYRLTCTYNSNGFGNVSKYDEITINVPPRVELTGNPSGLLPLTATTGQTQSFVGVALNNTVTLSDALVRGANACNLSSVPPGVIIPRNKAGLTTNATYNLNGLFGVGAVASIGLAGTTTFSLSCTGPGGVSFAELKAIVSEGNCAFGGNNQIQSFVLCKNSLTTLNGGDNLDLKGAFVARSFNIDSASDNIRFFYDYNTGDKVPPGFRYLNIPSPKEVGNSGN